MLLLIEEEVVMAVEFRRAAEARTADLCENAEAISPTRNNLLMVLLVIVVTRSNKGSKGRIRREQHAGSSTRFF